MGFQSLSIRTKFLMFTPYYFWIIYQRWVAQTRKNPNINLLSLRTPAYIYWNLVSTCCYRSLQYFFSRNDWWINKWWNPIMLLTLLLANYPYLKDWNEVVMETHVILIIMELFTGPTNSTGYKIPNAQLITFISPDAARPWLQRSHFFQYNFLHQWIVHTAHRACPLPSVCIELDIIWT